MLLNRVKTFDNKLDRTYIACSSQSKGGLLGLGCRSPFDEGGRMAHQAFITRLFSLSRFRGLKRGRIVAALAAGAALTIIATAMATNVVYAGPKTWLPGYDGDSSYDSSGSRWYYNFFENRSYNSWGRVTFIDNNGGGWHMTYDAWGTLTGNGWSSSDPDADFGKKAFCDNTDTGTYTGYCDANHN
jgi:hypothetical protein